MIGSLAPMKAMKNSIEIALQFTNSTNLIAA